MENAYFYLMKMAWRHVGSRKRLFVITYVFFILANIVHMLEPLVIGYAFNTLQTGGAGAFTSFTFWLVVITLMVPAFWLLHGPARIWEQQLAYIVERRLRQKLFRTLTRLPMSWHNDHHSGETHDKVEKAANALGRFAQSGFEPLATFVRAVVSVIAMTLLFPLFGWLSAVALLVILLIMNRFDQYLFVNRRTINEREHGVAQLFFDYVTNIKSIITLRLERLVEQSYSQGLGQIYQPLRKNILVNEFKWGSLGNMIAVATFLLLLLYVYVNIGSGETILLGTLFAFYGYINRFTESFFDFASQWGDLVQWQTDVHSVDSIVAAHDELGPAKNLRGDIRSWQQIQISNLNFSHADARGNVNQLDAVTLDLQRGTTVALVGESGSGKSTLLHLLRGLYAPDRAKLVIDERPYNFGILRKITTLVPQDPEVFDNTIGYNISLGLDHTPQEITQAIALAKFDPVLERLEKGLETSIKERGVNLSGGEKQRLALARAIFTAKDSSLILMDESTSSVDSGNELEIYRNMFEHFQDHCIIAAVHRLHLLPLFDVVYVLDQGKIIEQGSFAELTAQQDGVLAKMWQRYVVTLESQD